jgi:aspartate kinase
MKFGGSSVADLERLASVARFVAARSRESPVVVVVSAMGKTTDALVRQALALSARPSQRELDMLLSTGERTAMALLSLALQGLDVPAISLTGSQCGIITDHQHGRARIVEVRPFRILDELVDHRVVIVGGFQGVSYKREVTTLGRGGSDTTAVALAAALGADCEIYSDVEGVYSADPRVVPEATRVEALSYDEMRALSRAGAKVLHARAVELAEEKAIAIYARATPGGTAGAGETVVRRSRPGATGVSAVACDASVRALQIDAALSAADIAGLARSLADLGLRYLRVDATGVRGVLSATQRDDADTALERLRADLPAPIAARLVVLADLALVACVGVGLEERGEAFVAAIEALESRGIAVVEVATDANTLAFLVAAPDAAAATQLLHAALIRT